MPPVSGCAGLFLASSYVYILGVVMKPLEQMYGWSRTDVSMGSIIVGIVAFFSSPFVGMIVDRFGPRRVALVGVTLYSLAFAFVGTMGSDVRSWWIRWGILAVAFVFISQIVWMAGAVRWFVRHRGLAIGVTALGPALCSITLPMIAASLVARVGVGPSFMWLGLIGGSLVGILVLLFFADPTMPGAVPASTSPTAGHRQAFADLGQALSRREFWLLLASGVLASTAIIGVIVHFIPLLSDAGMAPSRAARLAGLTGLASLAGRLGTGYLLDRYHVRYVALPVLLLPALGVSILGNFPVSPVTAATAAITLGFALGAETDCIAYALSRFFSMRNYGAVLGTIAGAIGTGAGIGPVLAGAIYDSQGNYHGWLLTAAGALCIAGGVMIFVRNYPEDPDEDTPFASVTH